MFLGLHLPGWYFVGALRPSQAVVAGGVLLVGLVAGYARHRARSTWAAVVVHFLNNLYSAFVN
jgi:membrane protease YdiL (CAAX protease family)